MNRILKAIFLFFALGIILWCLWLDSAKSEWRKRQYNRNPTDQFHR